MTLNASDTRYREDIRAAFHRAESHHGIAEICKACKLTPTQYAGFKRKLYLGVKPLSRARKWLAEKGFYSPQSDNVGVDIAAALRQLGKILCNAGKVCADTNTPIAKRLDVLSESISVINLTLPGLVQLNQSNSDTNQDTQD